MQSVLLTRKCRVRELRDREVNAQYHGPWGPIKCLKIMERFVSGDVHKLLFSVSLENSTVIITIFCLFCFEAVARGLREVSINLLKCAVVSRIRLLFNYNL